MKKEINIVTLEQLLGTINSRVIKQIEVTLLSCCTTDMPSYAYVKVGYITYVINLMDLDIRYWRDYVFYFADVIRNCGIYYTCNEYKQQTCDGYISWYIE